MLTYVSIAFWTLEISLYVDSHFRSCHKYICCRQVGGNVEGEAEIYAAVLCCCFMLDNRRSIKSIISRRLRHFRKTTKTPCVKIPKGKCLEKQSENLRENSTFGPNFQIQN